MRFAALLFQLSSAEVDAGDQPLLYVTPCIHHYFQQITVHSVENIHSHCLIYLCCSLLHGASGRKVVTQDVLAANAKILQAEVKCLD